MSPVHLGAALGVGLVVILIAIGVWRLHAACRLATQEAQRYRERFQALFAAGFEGVVIHEDGVIVDANGALERLFGYSLAELRQMPLEQLVTEDYRALARERMRNRSESVDEAVGRRKDGSVFPLEVLGRDYTYQGRAVRVVAARDISARRQAEAEERERDERFERFFQAAPVGLYSVGADGRIVMANRALARVLGLPENADLTGMDVRAIPGSGGDLLRMCSDGGDGEEDVERSWVRADGSRVVVRLHSSSVLGDDGTPVYCQGSIEDVTERSRTEDALRAGDARLRAIVAASGEAIIVGDRAGNIIFWNRAAEAIFGYSAEEALGKHVSMVMARHCRDAGMAAVARAADTVSPQVPSRLIEAAGTRKDGSEFPCELSVSVGRAGNDLYITASVRDTSERFRASEALRRSEERYRHLFNSGSDAVFINGFDADGMPGKFTEVNDVACERLGFTRAELLLMRPGDIRAPETMTDFPAVVGRLRRDKQVLWETVHVAKNGDRIPVEINAHLAELGGIPTVILAARDISERKRLEQRLLNAQKMETVGRLAGGVAHDFNNLLTAISGHASFALEDLPAAAKGREDIEEVLVAAERAAALTQQLLAFSRRQVMRPRALNLNDLVADMEGVLQGSIGDDNTLIVATAPGLGLVQADAGQIHQVIANLVLNARDALPEGGRIVIETANVSLDDAYTAVHVGAVAGDYVMLSVSDTGVGIPPDVREHLFEPFFTTKGLGKGTGLGLATVYGIVKQHQGNIWVYSEPGRGTSLKVYLPRLPSEDQPLQRIEATVLPTGDETVLVAEDEPVVRGVVTRVLRQLGYKAVEAANGSRALALAEQHGDLRLLITDVVMPEMGGVDLAHRLQHVRPGVRILFTSGYTDATLADCDSFGPSADFLAKPFSARGLAGKVRELLDRE